MTNRNTAGFDLVNWNNRAPVEMVSLTFAEEYLRPLPSYGKIPEGYEGYPYDATYGQLNLFVENIGPGFYHVSLRDYSCGWTRDLGEGTYDYDYEEHPGWSDIERILTDLQRRIAGGEIDLDKELMEYYTVVDDPLRMKPACIRKGRGGESPRADEREAVRLQLQGLENKAFARKCMELMRKGRMADEDVFNLEDKGFCESAFGGGFPVLKRTSAKYGPVPRGEALVNGDQKYYYDVFELNGRHYIVTNDWYGFKPGARRNNRAPFVEWMLDRIARQA